MPVANLWYMVSLTSGLRLPRWNGDSVAGSATALESRHHSTPTKIDIGRLSPAFPVTPPCVRVRIRRFCELGLETASFQALPFYEGLGYRTFGELPEISEGETLFFLKKEENADR